LAKHYFIKRPSILQMLKFINSIPNITIKKCINLCRFLANNTGMKFIISILLLSGVFPLLSMAQSAASFPKPAILHELQTSHPDQGTVQIVEDPRIDELLARQLEVNRRNNGITGYRILIFKDGSQNSKKAAFDAKSLFLKNFPDNEVYYVYEPPESKLFVGDFRTKSEATRMKLAIEKVFPKAIIIETKINFPNLETKEDKQ
jgi:hypothetical protein